MSLFGWFRRPAFETEPDRVYLTREAKWRGLTATAADRGQARDRVLIVAHFPATLRECLDRLHAAGLAADLWDKPATARELTDAQGRLNSAVTLIPAPALVVADPPTDELAGAVPERWSLLVPELHALPEHEQGVAAFAASLPGRVRLATFASLEDPVVARACGPWVSEVLRKLGMQEEEAIQSDLVSRQIRRAQQKLSKQAEKDAAADSAEEWLERNIRQ
jgi:hypothetical protein